MKLNKKMVAVFCLAIGLLFMQNVSIANEDDDKFNKSWDLLLYGSSEVTGSSGLYLGEIASVTYGKGKYVAIDENGNALISSSKDVTFWISSKLESRFGDGSQVIYGNGRFVVSGGGSLYISKDAGITWEKGTTTVSVGTSTVTISGNNVVYGSGGFVALGSSEEQISETLTGFVTRPYVSADMKTWTRGQMYGKGGKEIQAEEIYAEGVSIGTIAYGGGRYVGTGGWVSDGGKVWSDKDFDASVTLDDITYANGQFIGSYYTQLYTSTDGIKWTQKGSLPSSTALGRLVYGNGKYVVYSSESELYVSDDLETWTTKTSETKEYPSTCLSYVNGIFIGGQGYGGIVTSAARLEFEWNKVFSSFSTVNGIACGKLSSWGYRYVIAADRPLVSKDGVSWKMIYDDDITMRAVTFGNDEFLGFQGNAAYISKDGYSWDKEGELESGPSVRAVAYGKDLYVAVTDSGSYDKKIFTSKDGTKWKARKTTPILIDTSEKFNDVVYGNKKYVAVGASGLIVTSKNGAKWSVVRGGGSSGNRALNRVVYGNGVFVAVGDSGTTLSSKDGAKWEQSITGLTDNITSLAYGGGYFVAGGGFTGALVSQDGYAWEKSDYPENGLSQLCYYNGYFYGYDGKGIYRSAKIGKSTPTEEPYDPLDYWTQRPFPTSGNLYGVTFGGSKFFAVGSGGTILGSSDGESWEEKTSGTSENLYGVSYNSFNDYYVAVGSRGIAPHSIGGDTSWEDTCPKEYYNTLHAITSGGYGNKFIAVGEGGIILMSDIACGWEKREAEVANDLNDITTDGQKKVVIVSNMGLSDYGTVLFSNNGGLGWNTVKVDPGSNIKGVTYGKNLFVAVGEGYTLTSKDGEKWKSNASKVDLHGVTYGGGYYVAVGTGGKIMTSKDGVTWKERQSGTDNDLRRVVYGNNTFVVVGGNGTILQSDPLE